jgi:hypothetical protein
MVRSGFPTTWKVAIEIKKEGKYQINIVKKKTKNAIALGIQNEK